MNLSMYSYKANIILIIFPHCPASGLSTGALLHEGKHTVSYPLFPGSAPGIAPFVL